MKRITLNIDLEDNEVFEKEVKDAIRSEVRALVRSENIGIIKKEAEAEISRIISAREYGYRDCLKNTVKSIAYDSIKSALENMNIDEVVQEGLKDCVESKIIWYSDIVSDRCKETLDEILTKEVNEKLKRIIN